MSPPLNRQRCVLVVPDSCLASGVPVSQLAAAWSVSMVPSVAALSPDDPTPVVMFCPAPADVEEAARTVAAPIIVVSPVQSNDDDLAFLRAGASEVLDWDSAGATPPDIDRALARAHARREAPPQALSGGAQPLSQDNAVALTVVDRLPLGLFLTRADATLVHCNVRGRRILLAATALALDTKRRLRASTTAETAKLRTLIAAMSQGTTDMDGALAVRQTSGAPPLSVIVVPAGTAGHGAALFVSAHDMAVEIREENLESLYGLTLAEARLVKLLVQGMTLEAISEERGHSRHTLRAQLKAIFRKTNVNRQSDLVKLVLTGPAIINCDRTA